MNIKKYADLKKIVLLRETLEFKSKRTSLILYPHYNKYYISNFYYALKKLI